MEKFTPLEDNEENNSKSLAELLPSKVAVANRCAKGLGSDKGEAYKFAELILKQIMGDDGLDKEIKIIFDGTTEVRIDQWNTKIDDFLEKDNSIRSTFEDLVKQNGLLLDTEKEALLGINAVAMKAIAEDLYRIEKAKEESQTPDWAEDMAND